MDAMNQRIYGRRGAGFSLIEVLVAVVVLSFGLLALAALQGSLFKASTESKMQSVGLGLATEKLEFFRGYRDSADYLAMTSSTTPETVTIGGIPYTRSWTVTRYAYPAAGGNFVSVANTTTLGSAYAANNEFKRIVVTVSWTDAQGKPQFVTLEDAIAAINPGDSARLAKSATFARPRGPEVKIYNPTTQQQGVIPIAIGDSTDTAATNPKPLINAGNVVETRFDILTYTGASGDTAISQSRIQTSVVGCKCDYGNAADDTIAMRPTYWDGTHYVTPEAAGYAPPAGVASSASTQSDICTICCRDHHDPSNLQVGAAKFDPRNSSHSLGHFLLNESTGVLSGQRTSGLYTEVCRVIRVGGFYRTAADTYDDFMNVLDAKNDGSTSAYVPTAAATTNYQNFVKAYLDARVVTPSLNYNDRPTGISGLESANSINTQTAININRTNDFKWLHLRGLYIDYLEDAAVQAINDAKDNCAGTGGLPPDATQLETCVLRVLPFTSINLTELGNWTPVTGTQIVVANNNFSGTLSSTEPVRGKVRPGSNPTPNTTTNALGTMRRSNSGLTTLIAGIDTEDALTSEPSTWVATQPFTIQGSSGGNGGSFTATLAVDTGAYPFAENILTPYINSSLAGVTCNKPPYPYACTSSATLGVAQTLTVGNYNYQQAGTSTAALSCSNGTTTIAYSGPAYATKICRNYAVTGVSINGTSALGALAPVSPTEGKRGESTSFTLGSPAINNGDVLGITFGTPVDTTQPLTCSYTTVCKGQSNNCTTTFQVTSEDCP
jgi:type IV pilus modification protein PilV